jgi:hypothetical protein
MKFLIAVLIIFLSVESQAESFTEIFSRECSSTAGCSAASSFIIDDRGGAHITQIGTENYIYVAERDNPAYSDSIIRKFDLSAGTPSSPFFSTILSGESDVRLNGAPDSSIVGVASRNYGTTNVSAKFKLLSSTGSIMYSDPLSIPNISSGATYANSLRLLVNRTGNTYVVLTENFPQSAFSIYQKNGEQVSKFGPFNSPSFGAHKEAAISSDGRYFVLIYGGRFDIYDLNIIRAGQQASMALSQVFTATLSNSISAVSISHDNKIAVCGLHPTAPNFLAHVEMIQKGSNGSWINQQISIPPFSAAGNICRRLSFTDSGSKLWTVTTGSDNLGMNVALLDTSNLNILNQRTIFDSITQTIMPADVSVKGDRLLIGVHSNPWPGQFTGEDLFLLDSSKRRILTAKTKIQNSTGIADVSFNLDGTKALVHSRASPIKTSVFNINP